MATLTKEQLQLVDQVCGDTADVATAARLYVVEDNEWMFTGLTGAVVVVLDTQLGAYFLRLIDLDLRSVVWEQEFYDNFQYFKSTGFLHTLECDNCVAGLSFASTAEAKFFWQGILQAKAGAANTHPTKNKQKKAKEPKESKDKTANAPGTGAGAKKKMKGAFKFSKKGFGKASKKIGSVFEKEEKEELIISGPRNFRHSSHIGWNSDEGFKIRDIPDAWKRIFKASGIKKSELKDKETAAYIMDVIANTMGVDVEEIGEAPPADLGSAPPPPPPPTSSNKGNNAVAIVTNAPPPPPPPPPGLNAPPPPGGLAPPLSEGSSTPVTGPVNIFDQIKQGTTLKTVEVTETAPIVGNTLADTLASAMANRRGAVDSDSESDESGWSDSD